MTFLVRSLVSMRPASRALFRPVASFHTSSSRWALSEHDRDDPDRAGKVDKHKDDSISKAKDGKGEWKPELASQSEQSLKQDKNTMSMDEMTKMGEQQAQEGKTPSGTDSSQGGTT